MPKEAVHPAIVQAAWSAVGAVPGCALSHVTINVPTTQTVLRVMTVGITGWSPSLHLLEHEWMVPVDMAPDLKRPDHVVHAERLVAGMRDRLNLQRARAAAALALGQPRPLRVVAGARTEIAHLHADASVLALLVARGQEQGNAPCDMLDGIVGSGLNDLHREAMDHDGANILRNAVTCVHDHGRLRMVDPAFDLTSGRPVMKASATPAGAVSAVLRGDVLTVVNMEVPLTVLTGAKGLRVGRIIDIDERVAARRIDSVTIGDNWFGLTLRPAPVRIGEVMALGADDALRRLADVHG